MVRGLENIASIAKGKGDMRIRNEIIDDRLEAFVVYQQEMADIGRQIGCRLKFADIHAALMYKNWPYFTI